MAAQLQAIADRVCRSATFRSSPRLRDFLRYLVSRNAVEGQAKETLVGIEFFQREPGYDPRKDPIVRVEAHRLRRRLREYYQKEGAEDPYRIELPAGAYVPILRRAEEAANDYRLMVRVEAPDALTAEGLTAELIRQLGALPGVKVLAPLSTLAARGDLGAARQNLARLESLNEASADRAIFRAWAHASAGDVDRGMQYLELAVDDADPHALYVEVFPPNAPLRAHPRYPEVLRRQRLPRLNGDRREESVTGRTNHVLDARCRN